TYYTLPFFQPPSASLSHSASTFKTIVSQKGQRIERYSFDAGSSTGVTYNYFQSFKKYDLYDRNDIAEPSRFFSDAPFLLVQYSNSQTYPDGVNSQSDP